ncbi:hypothetical protein E2C01_081078 [Portunus trituberculatus]|uniref:Uncharacterized protein n=1 Tax=Portunus trituberculatus TaxID=210409 RepID=A0A5B7IUU9_PORTR|nr:hypothetical protein [Portunus trituberculatus]
MFYFFLKRFDSFLPRWLKNQEEKRKADEFPMLRGGVKEMHTGRDAEWGNVYTEVKRKTVAAILRAGIQRRGGMEGGQRQGINKTKQP